MKKKRTLVVGIGVCVLVGAFFAYWTTWRFERVVVEGRAMDIVEEYSDYYYTAKDRRVRLFFNPAVRYGWKTTISFLPGHRERMLEQIKEDVINELETLIREHGDAFSKYEICDDFKQVRIYMASEDVHGISYDFIVRLDERLGTLIELYHNTEDGYRVIFSGAIVVFVEPGD